MFYVVYTTDGEFCINRGITLDDIKDCIEEISHRDSENDFKVFEGKEIKVKIKTVFEIDNV
jgi:hypothetical protein